MVTTTKKKPVKKQRCIRCGKSNAIVPAKTCPTCKRKAKKEKLAKARDAHAQKTYGLRPGELAKLDANAPLGPSTCYICGGKASGKLNTDHNHKTGAVRGRLCSLCNRHLLGLIGKDDPERLAWIMERAVRYLREEPAQQILREEE